MVHYIDLFSNEIYLKTRKEEKNNMLKINLGCGPKKMPGFINVDIRPDVNPDIIDDVGKLKKIENNSVDLLYSSHVLEHFDYQESAQVLKRWFDVVKPGGEIRLAVPDIERVCEAFLFYKDFKYIRSAFWGSQRHPFDYHKNGWNFDSLKADLEKVGFKNVQRYDWKEFDEHREHDDYSQAYLPHMKKDDGVLISLNVRAWKI